MYNSQGAASGTGGGEGGGPPSGAAAAYSRFPKILTFEVKPQEVRFCDFEPHKTYETPLHLKNRTKETQFVRVAQPQSRVLSLRPPRNNITTMKVAPGLSVTYKVLFTPEENKDYNSELVVTTENEEFTVPVHAIASRGHLTLPDSFTVKPSPVRGSVATTLFLRNTGRLDCQWRAEASPPFAITPSTGTVAAEGAVFPVSIEFSPKKLKQYESTISFFLGPEEDVVQKLPVVGSAVEVAVVLEESTLEFPSTFVTLEHQALVHVRNDSDFTLHFSWKSDGSEADEQRALDQNLFDQTEAVMYAVLSNSPHKTTQKRLQREKVKLLTAGGRVFDDDVFTLQPVSGTIYSKGSQEFVVTFNPQLAMDYLATAFLEIEGKQQRLPLQVKGAGLGPQCELEYDRLDIGDIFVGALHEYKVAIINTGCIEARYTVLLQDTLMGRKFQFHPPEGVLPPKGEETIFIQLQSDLVGLISETFRIHLHGSVEDLTLRIRGRVTGPSLQFDVGELDFGNISYNCLHSRATQMENIGHIPIHFHLRTPETSSMHSLITVTPSEGVILPKKIAKIRVDLASDIVGNCETMLLVDVDGVGKGVDSLPIKAACLVPTLQISTEKLHYGTCFVGHDYIMNLEVVNKTALFGKYNVILLNEEGARAANAVVVIDPSSDKPTAPKVIEPRSRSQVPIKLTPLAVGGLHMTLYVRVLGSDEPPLPVLLTAAGRGPTVTVEPKSLAFGTLMLLEHAEREFTLSNTSPIPAVFNAKFVQGAKQHSLRSVFSIDCENGEIPPYSHIVVKVKACLDEARNFSEKIQIIVKHAEDDVQFISLTALGKGYALVPAEPIEKIDFEDVFTSTVAEKSIILRNDGYRDVEVLWSCGRSNRGKGGAPSAVYRIIPESAAIHSRGNFTFTVQGFSEEAGMFTEEFILKDKKEFRQILTTSVTGKFVLPLITYSTKRVVFDYIYNSSTEGGDVNSSVMMKTFTMKNTTSQVLHVSLKRVEAPSGALSPFSLIAPTSFTLMSGETHIVGINCDAFYRHDTVAHTIKGKILVTFTDHPLSECISLCANIAFPTISILPEDHVINFGSILADTEGRQELTLVNLSSLVPAEFAWKIQYHNESTCEELYAKQKHFDFVPFRGVIPPGEKRTVEAVFYGTKGKHEATGTCILKGGPSYTVNLVGWSDASVRFDCTSLDFGIMHHLAQEKKTISISSPSRVAIPFTVNIDPLKSNGSITVKPMSGVVTNKVVLTVWFSPLTPEEVIGTFYVQAGHLDPQPITVRGLGQAYTVMVTTPDKNITIRRENNDPQFVNCLEELKEKPWVPYLEKSGYTAVLPNIDPLVLEAERQAYCRNLRMLFDSVAFSSTPPSSRTDGGEKKDEDKVILAHYFIDFGNMTRMEVRTIRLLLTNTCIYPVTVSLDKRVMGDGSLCIEPKKVPSLAPFTDTELTLTFSPNNCEHVSYGENIFNFFIHINKGPRIVVEVRCFVATPGLTPSATELDFGDVLLGRIKNIPLHFTNQEAVPCVWRMSLSEPRRKQDAADAESSQNDMTKSPGVISSAPPKKQFKISKERGILYPQSCMTIMASFISCYLGPAKAKLHLRYASNPEEYHIIFKGNVRKINVEISPSKLVFPPIFPCQVMKSSFHIINHEEKPVEIYNMNFDEKYKTELGILQYLLMQQKEINERDGEVYLPVREGNGCLPEDLLNSVFLDIQRRDMQLEYKDWDNVDGCMPTDRRTMGSRSSSRRPQSLQTKSDPRKSIIEESHLSKPHELMKAPSLLEIKPQVVVIIGPPFSGKTTQVKKLLESLKVVRLDLDAMIRAEAEFDTAEGELIRNILTEKEEQRKNNNKSGDNNNNNNNNNTGILMRGQTAPQLESLHTRNDVKILYTLLLRQLFNVDSVVDIVIDDCKCFLTDDREALLFAIEKATSMVGRVLHLVSLGISEATIGLRHYLEMQERCRKTMETAKTLPLTEDQYEALDMNEREVYNRRLLYYNACKQALTEATNEVTHYAEKRDVSRQTIQEIIDAEIKTKKEQEMVARSGSKNKKVVPEVCQTPRWNQLSELDQYKALYTQLREAEESRNTANATSSKAAANLADASKRVISHILIDGEKEEKEVYDHLVENLFKRPDHDMEQTQHTLCPSEDKAKKDEIALASFLTSSSLYFSDKRRSGLWELITEDTIRDNYEDFKEFRFYTVTQKDMIVKKNAKSSPLCLSSYMDESTRWTIPPNSSVEVTVIFSSGNLGVFEIPFAFGITGTSQKLFLPVTASTSFPEISRDDKTIFARTKSRTIANRQMSRVFLTSKRTYEFGPLVVPGGIINTPSTNSTRKGRTASEQESLSGANSIPSGKELGAQDTLTFTNTGIFPADVSIFFGKEKENTFSVTPNKFTLQVGGTASVVLRAVPEAVGEVSSILVVTVKDNPTPWFVHVSCIGTRPAIALDDKKESVVQFGRCLITRRVERTIMITNDSLMPIRWRISGMDKLPSEFEIKSPEGLLDVNGAYPLEIIYKPTRPCIHNVTLKVEVTDSDDTLYEVLPITIKAEAHDVVIEWTRHVDFKLMHVGETRKEVLRILNKSPYEVGYLLRLPKPLQQLITLNPSEGVIRGLVGFKDASVVNIEVTIRFDKEGEIPSSLGVIEAFFFDPVVNELLFPVQNIAISGEAWYNKFTIKPSCIDFGSCVANQKKQSTFELRNVGKFPLNFRLFNYKNGLHAFSTSLQEDEENANRKHRKTIKAVSGFQLGVFSIVPSFGMVAIGDVCVFHVVTIQDSGASNKETLGIYIDHCDQEIEMKGIPFELVASPTTPSIMADLSSLLDVETIFEEQQIVTSLSQRNKSLRVYSREDRVFSFGSVLVGNHIEERFRIANSSPITCSVKIQLLPSITREGKEKDKEKKEKEKDTLLRVDGFALSIDGEAEGTDVIQLPSFESRYVTISFMPMSLQKFKSHFEAHVIGGTDPKTSHLQFDVIGEGILPIVEYVFPPKLQVPFTAQVSTQSHHKKNAKGKGKESKNKTLQYTFDEANISSLYGSNNANGNVGGSLVDMIQLPFTLVGDRATREFSIRNVGSIDTHIRVSTLDELPQDISITNMKEELLLPMNETKTFTVTFSPTSIQKYHIRLLIFITENPYENREVILTAGSYFNIISFENIDPGSEDHLTLCDCYVSQPLERCVIMRNNSPHTVRFDWNSASSSSVLQCTPSVGHIPPGSYKSLMVKIYSDAVSRETISSFFNITSIELKRNRDEQQEATGGGYEQQQQQQQKELQQLQGGNEIDESWDNAQVKPKWVVSSPSSDESDGKYYSSAPADHNNMRKNVKRVFEPFAEPPYHVTSDINMQKYFYVTYACNFTNYKVTLPMNNDVEVSDQLIFPTTKIFQRNSIPLRIRNTGFNQLPFSFEIYDTQSNASIKGGSASSITRTTNAKMENKNMNVFTVEPSSGSIKPLTYQDVHVTYAPKSVDKVTQVLIGQFSFSADPKMYISLQGTAECPLVHFNVPPCDYLSTRVEGEAGPDLSPDTVPIIFQSCGLQSKCAVNFKVINPSLTAYRFEWISVPSSQRVSPFRCLTPSGTIAAGKQYEMIFDYTANSIDIREAKWTFFISGHLSVPFLLIGKASEPRVFLHVNRVNFGTVIIGSKGERIIELENQENISFPFSFDRTMFHADSSSVSIKPISGVVPANSRIPLTVSFIPKDESMTNVRLLCLIKRLSDPLTINVKGEGIRIHSAFFIEDEDPDDMIEPITVPQTQVFPFNLGRIQLETTIKKRFVLANEGQCPMEYVIIVPEHRFIKLNPLSGTILPKQRHNISFVYSPLEEENLRNFKIQCKIEKSIVYNIRLSVVSYIPKVQFSFMKHDFGPCFITEFSYDAIASKTLSMVNTEAKENVALDCTLPKNDVFELDGTSFVLSPGEVRNLTINFIPHEVGEFENELKIVLNGSYSFFIPLRGEGVIPRIDVPIQFLKLGVARIGEKRTGELRLDCRSRTVTPISLSSSVSLELQEKGISIFPNELFLMRPREMRTITVTFKPPMRMSEFQRELKMMVCGREMPLAMISGSCEDAEVHLDIQNVLFDDVVIGTSASRRIVIMNSGDVPQRYKWELALVPQSEMKIIPASGLVRAHSEQVCEFVYTPKKVGNVFRRVVTIDFDDAPQMTVNVEAHAVERPKAESLLLFSCRAKSTDTKNVSIENPTDVVWSIRPVLDNRLWTTVKMLQINPRSSSMISVTYSPLFAYRDKDIGTLFIPFPNGSARVIQLEGVASHQTDEGNLIEKVVEANTLHTETFEVHNATSQPLRFYVNVVWTPEPEKGTVTVKMPVSVDVPAKQARECPVSFSSLKEGLLRGSVQFRCPEREDHTQTFDVALQIVTKTISSKTELVATARTSAIYRMMVTNPLEKNVTVTTRVENGSDVIFVDPSFVIPRKSTTEIPVRFFPLIHKDYPAATVTATSAELGNISCHLHLRSKPPGLEKVVRISCPLGQTLVFPLRFKHFCKSSCDFAVRFGSKSTPFSKVGSAGNAKAPGTTRPEGQDVTVEILYEPTSVGEIKENIELFSAQAGLYVFPVLASCLPPQRQGPFLLRAGQATSIPFRNVFTEPITVTLTTDSPCFVVPKASENIAAKKSINIQVTYKPEEGGQGMATGKLTVAGVHDGETLRWVYYLKCVPTEGSSAGMQNPKRKE